MSLIFVRHGRTHSNEVGHETLRGWLPIPLSLDGMAETKAIAEQLDEVADIAHLYCGTLVRVIQSAGEIAQVLQMELEPDDDYNDWNTGDFAGEPVKQTLDDLHSHIRNPERDVPGGEPFQAFLDRICPLLVACVEGPDVNILVSSGRVSTLLKALSVNSGEYPDTQTLLGKPPVDPAGVLILDRSWRILFNTTKSEESKGLS